MALTVVDPFDVPSPPPTEPVCEVCDKSGGLWWLRTSDGTEMTGFSEIKCANATNVERMAHTKCRLMQLLDKQDGDCPLCPKNLRTALRDASWKMAKIAHFVPQRDELVCNVCRRRQGRNGSRRRVRRSTGAIEKKKKTPRRPRTKIIAAKQPTGKKFGVSVPVNDIACIPDEFKVTTKTLQAVESTDPHLFWHLLNTGFAQRLPILVDEERGDPLEIVTEDLKQIAFNKIQLEEFTPQRATKGFLWWRLQNTDWVRTGITRKDIQASVKAGRCTFRVEQEGRCFFFERRTPSIPVSKKLVDKLDREEYPQIDDCSSQRWFGKLLLERIKDQQPGDYATLPLADEDSPIVDIESVESPAPFVDIISTSASEEDVPSDVDSEHYHASFDIDVDAEDVADPEQDHASCDIDVDSEQGHASFDIGSPLDRSPESFDETVAPYLDEMLAAIDEAGEIALPEDSCKDLTPIGDGDRVDVPMNDQILGEILASDPLSVDDAVFDEMLKIIDECEAGQPAIDAEIGLFDELELLDNKEDDDPIPQDHAIVQSDTAEDIDPDEFIASVFEIENSTAELIHTDDDEDQCENTGSITLTVERCHDMGFDEPLKECFGEDYYINDIRMYWKVVVGSPEWDRLCQARKLEEVRELDMLEDGAISDDYETENGYITQ